MKKIIKIVIIILGVFVVIGIAGVTYLSYGKNQVLKEEVNSINLEEIDDGVYTGTYKSFRWSSEVEVKVENHKITKITIKKDHTFPQGSVSEELFKQVIAKQSLDVDTVSGATVSSKAYLEAIEDALSN